MILNNNYQKYLWFLYSFISDEIIQTKKIKYQIQIEIFKKYYILKNKQNQNNYYIINQNKIINFKSNC